MLTSSPMRMPVIEGRDPKKGGSLCDHLLPSVDALRRAPRSSPWMHKLYPRSTVASPGSIVLQRWTRSCTAVRPWTDDRHRCTVELLRQRQVSQHRADAAHQPNRRDPKSRSARGRRARERKPQCGVRKWGGGTRRSPACVRSCPQPKCAVVVVQGMPCRAETHPCP